MPARPRPEQQVVRLLARMLGSGLSLEEVRALLKQNRLHHVGRVLDCMAGRLGAKTDALIFTPSDFILDNLTPRDIENFEKSLRRGDGSKFNPGDNINPFEINDTNFMYIKIEYDRLTEAGAKHPSLLTSALKLKLTWYHRWMQSYSIHAFHQVRGHTGWISDRWRNSILETPVQDDFIVYVWEHIPDCCKDDPKHIPALDREVMLRIARAQAGILEKDARPLKRLSKSAALWIEDWLDQAMTGEPPPVIPQPVEPPPVIPQPVEPPPVEPPPVEPPPVIPQPVEPPPVEPSADEDEDVGDEWIPYEIIRGVPLPVIASVEEHILKEAYVNPENVEVNDGLYNKIHAGLIECRKTLVMATKEDKLYIHTLIRWYEAWEQLYTESKARLLFVIWMPDDWIEHLGRKSFGALKRIHSSLESVVDLSPAQFSSDHVLQVEKLLSTLQNSDQKGGNNDAIHWCEEWLSSYHTNRKDRVDPNKALPGNLIYIEDSSYTLDDTTVEVKLYQDKYNNWYYKDRHPPVGTIQRYAHAWDRVHGCPIQYKHNETHDSDQFSKSSGEPREPYSDQFSEPPDAAEYQEYVPEGARQVHPRNRGADGYSICVNQRLCTVIPMVFSAPPASIYVPVGTSRHASGTGTAGGQAGHRHARCGL